MYSLIFAQQCIGVSPTHGCVCVCVLVWTNDQWNFGSYLMLCHLHFTLSVDCIWSERKIIFQTLTLT